MALLTCIFRDYDLVTNIVYLPPMYYVLICTIVLCTMYHGLDLQFVCCLHVPLVVVDSFDKQLNELIKHLEGSVNNQETKGLNLIKFFKCPN